MSKLDNFVQALDNLHDVFDYNEPYGNVELAGLVALFEICFEQAWKATKEYLLKEGFSQGNTGSPRQVIKTAYQAGLVADEEAWLAALADRNNVAHAYDKSVALGIVANTKATYYELFKQLKTVLSKEREDASSKPTV